MGRPGVPFEATNQRGLFTRPQAYDEGWARRQVRRRLQAGRWKVAAGAALCDAATEVGPWELAHAVLLTWPGAVVSHQLAGVLHGFPIDGPLVATATAPLTKRSWSSMCSLPRRVVIEVDGYRTHSSRAAFQRDRSRQNDLVTAGSARVPLEGDPSGWVTCQLNFAGPLAAAGGGRGRRRGGRARRRAGRP